MSLRNLPRRVSRRHNPDILLDAGRIGGRVGIRGSGMLQIAAANEYN
jgi:hypothetical protein